MIRRGKPNVAFLDMIRPIPLFAVVFIFSVAQAANLASYKPYTLSEPGMVGLKFSSHNESDYSYVPVYNSDLDQALVWCENEPLSAAPHGLMWHHTDAPFNVSVTLDLETSVQVSQLRLFGGCCNMGIYTPTAAYLSGSDSADGPFTLIASKTNLTSGDQLETPAVTYILDLFAPPETVHYRYYRIQVTGEPNRYVSIISVQLFE